MRQNSQASNDRRAYIPPQVEQAMSQHLQQSLPGHLKQYVGPNKPAYVPERVERELNQQMQKNMPGHLKQYSGAYLQQHVISPTTVTPNTTPLPSRPPIPNPRRLDQSIPVGEQPSALWADLSRPTTMPSPASTSFAAQNPQQASDGQYGTMPPLQPEQSAGHSGHNPYEFIVNPNKPKKSGGLFGGSSFVKQIAVIVGGAVVLLVVAGVVISVLAPKKDSSASLTAIAQRQQEIIRVATLGATQATGQSAKNFTTNVELAVSSNQVQVLAYAQTKGIKLSPKLLALDRSTQTDKLLADAAATSTLDSAVTQNLTSQLTTYETSLRTAYKQSSSSKAKKVLQSSYNTAALLLDQAKQDTAPRP